MTDPERPESSEPDGTSLLRVAAIGTALFVLVAGIATAIPESGHHLTADHVLEPKSSLFAGLAAAVSLLLFVWGCGAFAWGYATAVSRSRVDQIELANLFFLSGAAAPKAVRRRLRGFLWIQVAVALAAAGIRPFSELAFGIMVPVFGLGMMALWGARHGSFPPRKTTQDPSPAKTAPPEGDDRPE